MNDYRGIQGWANRHLWHWTHHACLECAIDIKRESEKEPEGVFFRVIRTVENLRIIAIVLYFDEFDTRSGMFCCSSLFIYGRKIDLVWTKYGGLLLSLAI